MATMSYSQIPQQGDFLVIFIQVSGNNVDGANYVSTVVSSGASWKRALSVFGGAGDCELWYVPYVGGGIGSPGPGMFVSTTMTGQASGINTVIAEFSGVLAASPLDKSTSNTYTNQNQGNTLTAGPTSTTTLADELWLACFTNLVTPTTLGWTCVNPGQTVNCPQMWFKHATATGAASMAGINTTFQSAVSALIATFKAASSTPLPAPLAHLTLSVDNFIITT